MPPDPKLCRKPPDGDSTYARAGGVYPIAAFVDTLVERCLAARNAVRPLPSLTILCDDVRTPGATRHPPGLKYLLTEVRSRSK